MCVYSLLNSQLQCKLINITMTLYNWCSTWYFVNDDDEFEDYDDDDNGDYDDDDDDALH